ncbi:hypothetical protein AB0F43_19260 [Kribbella sp. NPDC023972]|uniref:hypothetical protein n=1 Tax=Kribbella sp. NPDC023972 TaxID=3154795 RepID=UPI0033EAFF86
MADERQVIAEARQALVRVLREMHRFMEGRSDLERDYFRGLLDADLPGVRDQLAEGARLGLSDAEVTERIQATVPPDRQGRSWEARTPQFFNRINRNHPVYADPAVRQAGLAYAGYQTQLQASLRTIQRDAAGIAGATAQEARQAASTYQRIQQAAARPDARSWSATPAAPPAQPRQAPRVTFTPPAAPATGNNPPGQPAQPQPQPTPQAPPIPQAPPTQQAQQPSSPQPGQQAHQPNQAQPAPSVGQGPAGGAQAPGTTRSISAAAEGPVTINAALLASAGKVVVRADPSCTQATLTIQTADQSGPAADAVRNANLSASADGRMQASVRGTGSSSSAIHISAGDISSINISGASVQIRGGVHNSNFTISGGSSPIEITAVVPEGSSLVGQTDSANIETHGRLNVANARTSSGGVRIDRADDINARTVDGHISMGYTDQVVAHSIAGHITIDDFGGSARADTISGDITVHATEGGRVTAGTVAGNISVTASNDAVAQRLTVHTSTTSGRISTPQPAMGAAPRRGSDGARNFHDANRTGQQRQSGNQLGT